MKKLYENIEDININGEISDLTDVVKAIDNSLQNIANMTEQLTDTLEKYSDVVKGVQFKKTVDNACELREMLYITSLEFNEMQNQVVEYQNKIYRFEDMTDYCQRPNPYEVNRRVIEVEDRVVQLKRSDLERVVAYLNKYNDEVYFQIKNILANKNDIASVWRDSQYQDFSEYIDGIAGKVVDSLKVFDDSVNYLNEKIKELE